MSVDSIPEQTMTNATLLIEKNDEDVFDLVRIIDIEDDESGQKNVHFSSKKHPETSLSLPSDIVQNWNIGDKIVLCLSDLVSDSVARVIAPDRNLDEIIGLHSFEALKQLLEKRLNQS